MFMCSYESCNFWNYYWLDESYFHCEAWTEKDINWQVVMQKHKGEVKKHVRVKNCFSAPGELIAATCQAVISFWLAAIVTDV